MGFDFINYQFNPVQGRVIIKQFHHIDFSVRENKLDIKAGTSRTIKLTINNIGNGIEEGVQLIVNNDVLKENGITVVVSEPARRVVVDIPRRWNTRPLGSASGKLRSFT